MNMAKMSNFASLHAHPQNVLQSFGLHIAIENVQQDFKISVTFRKTTRLFLKILKIAHLM